MPTVQQLDYQREKAERDRLDQYDESTGINRASLAMEQILAAQQALKQAVSILEERTDLECVDHLDIKVETNAIAPLLVNILTHLQTCESSRSFSRPQLRRKESETTLSKTLESYFTVHVPRPLDNYTYSCLKANEPLSIDGVPHFCFRHLHDWLRETRRAQYITQNELREILEMHRHTQKLLSVRCNGRIYQKYFWYAKR